MNKRFIYFWILFTGSILYLAIRFYFQTDVQLGLIFGSCGLFGLIIIIEILRKHKDFKLMENTLIIKQILRTETLLSLNKLKSWSLEQFHFRGQVKRTVHLKMENGQKVILSDKDDLLEFEKVHHHLKINFSRMEE